MPKPSSIVTAVAALMNDSVQDIYTNIAVLPYINMSLNILQEIYELNGLPVTAKSSAAITLKSGIHRLAFDTNPALPSDFIELEQVWESPTGLNQWTPVNPVGFIPHYLEDTTQISQFLLYAWINDGIELLAANSDNDLKLDYIRSIFKTPILIANIDVNLPFTNIESYLNFMTAALCAMFIAENESRAMELNGLAGDALSRALGIPIKGMQSIITRRRPFRSSFKRRGTAF